MYKNTLQATMPMFLLLGEFIELCALLCVLRLWLSWRYFRPVGHLWCEKNKCEILFDDDEKWWQPTNLAFFSCLVGTTGLQRRRRRQHDQAHRVYSRAHKYYPHIILKEQQKSIGKIILKLPTIISLTHSTGSWRNSSSNNHPMTPSSSARHLDLSPILPPSSNMLASKPQTIKALKESLFS